MVEDTAGGDALPLLAYTLRQLAERAGPDGRDQRGRLRGRRRRGRRAAAPADQLTEELARRGPGRSVVPTLLKLATLGPDGEPTRRRVLRTAFTAEERVVVDAFVDARLLTSDAARDPDRGTVSEEPRSRSRTRRCCGSGPRCATRSRPTGPGCGCARSWSGWPPTGSRAGATSPTCCAAAGWPRSTSGPPSTRELGP